MIAALGLDFKCVFELCGIPEFMHLAAAVEFGRVLSQILDVTIGVIHVSYG